MTNPAHADATSAASGPATRPAPRRAFRLAAGGIGLVLVLGLTEAGLRVYHGAARTFEIPASFKEEAAASPFAPCDDPELVYTYRRDAAVREMLRGDIESHGILQSREVSVLKSEGTLRIAVIGDSVGAAMNVAPGDRVPALLEVRLAAERRQRIEVLNFCVMGYDTIQEARVLETIVPPFSPDAVILVYCLNDPGISQTPRGWFRPPERPTSYLLHEIRGAIYRVTRRSHGRPWVTAKGPLDPVARVQWEQMYEPGEDGLAAVGQGFDRIAAWSRANGVPVLVAIAPLILPDDPQCASTARYRKQVGDAAAARGLPSIDLQPAFEGIPHATLAWLPDDIYHATAVGQAALARVLYPAVRDMVSGIAPRK